MIAETIRMVVCERMCANCVPRLNEVEKLLGGLGSDDVEMEVAVAEVTIPHHSRVCRAHDRKNAREKQEIAQNNKIISSGVSYKERWGRTGACKAGADALDKVVHLAYGERHVVFVHISTQPKKSEKMS